MFHHLVLMRFAPDSTPAQHRAVAEALTNLPEKINEIRGYEVNLDARLGAENAHLSVAAAFDSEADWRTYTDHPDHQRVIQELIAPILGSIMRSQYLD